MSSDKIVQLSQPWRMSLEVDRGTSRRTGGKACIPVLMLVLVQVLVQELRPVPVVEQGEPRKMVVSMVRKGQGGAEEVWNDRNNSGNGTSMV